MTDPSTPTAGLGGPDLTPTKSLTDSNGQTSWIGSGDVGPRPVRDSGNRIANWMIICGIAAAIIGGLFYAGNQGTYDSGELAQFGAAVSVTGELVAILGLHALAIRAPQSGVTG